MSSALLNSNDIKAQALRLGFVACGLAKAEAVAEDYAVRFRHWLELDYCAGMDYMRRNVDMRLHPDRLVPGVQTIVSLAMNFMPRHQQPAISLYAQGLDYHDVMRQRMNQLMQELHLEGRCFVDTAPVLERYWAWRSGIGIITPGGGFLSVPGYGPTVFLGELFLTAKADHYDSPLQSPFQSPLPAPPLGECLNLAGQGSFGGNGALPQRARLRHSPKGGAGRGLLGGLSALPSLQMDSMPVAASAIRPSSIAVHSPRSYVSALPSTDATAACAPRRSSSRPSPQMSLPSNLPKLFCR